eukprot:COSAG06_NODE_6848_length_2747_cov_3.544184_1_plen_50_part_10
MPRLAAALLLLLGCWASPTDALRHGEHVHTTKRSQFNEVRNGKSRGRGNS